MIRVVDPFVFYGSLFCIIISTICLIVVLLYANGNVMIMFSWVFGAMIVAGFVALGWCYKQYRNKKKNEEYNNTDAALKTDI